MILIVFVLLWSFCFKFGTKHHWHPLGVMGFNVEEMSPGNSAVTTSITVPVTDENTPVRFDGTLLDGFLFTQGDICIARRDRTKKLLEREISEHRINSPDKKIPLLNYTFWSILDDVDYTELSKDIGYPIDFQKIAPNRNTKKLLSTEVEGQHWPCPVPYEIAGAETDTVEDALEHWEEETPWRFVRRTTETDYIRFIDGSGCASWVGRRGGMQEVWLNHGCTEGNAIHEIGHAIGFYHEHARTDRDNFVRILDDNILSGYQGNFNKNDPDTSNDVGSYDFGSIMHYPSDAFAEEPGEITIQNIVPIPSGVTMGQRDELSNGDISSATLRHDDTAEGCEGDSGSSDSPAPPPAPVASPTSIPVEEVPSPVPFSPIPPISSEETFETESPTPRVVESMSPQTPAQEVSGQDTEEDTETDESFTPGPPPSPPSPSGNPPTPSPPSPRRRRHCTQGVCIIRRD